MTTRNTNTVYLIRHGENPANLTHDFSYKRVDFSLTAKGILQAEQTADYFKSQAPDEIYASPLKRARETAEIIARPFDLPVTLMENFREVNVGFLEGQPPTVENWNFHNRIIKDWVDGRRDVSFPGGENHFQLVRRMTSGLWEITHKKTDKRIIVVGHGGIFTWTLKCICPDVDMNMLMQVPSHNCSITEIELTTDADNVFGVLKAWASWSHLHGEAAQQQRVAARVEPIEENELQ